MREVSKEWADLRKIVKRVEGSHVRRVGLRACDKQHSSSNGGLMPEQ